MLGATGDGEDWSDLRNYLVGLGWQVDLFDATPYGGREGPESVVPRAIGVDMAILVVARSEQRVDLLAGRRLVHLAGVLQGQLGYGRLLVLQESDVEPFLHGTGIIELRYDRGDIGARFSEVGTRLGDLAMPGEAPPTPWLERFGIYQGQVGSEWWLVFGCLAVLAAVVFVFGYQFFGGASEDDGSDAASGTPLVTEAVAGPEVGSGDDSDLGGVAGLPAVCAIDTSLGAELAPAIDCDGGGRLRVDGFLGPWHQRISSVSLDLGVVGEAYPAGSSARAVPLQSGQERPVAGVDTEIGVERLVLEFSANGQQARLHQGVGDDVTFTFTLDS